MSLVDRLAVALTHRGLDRRIGLLLRLGRLLAGAHRGGLRRRLALLVGAPRNGATFELLTPNMTS